MAQRYLDTSVRRIPIRFYSRTLETGTTNRRKATFVELEHISLSAFKTRGGTPSVNDGVLTVIDTATATISWRDDIKRGDRVECLADGSMWEILHVENIDMLKRDANLTLRGCDGVA